MAVQFILGRSGTGKTSYCIKAIVNALQEAANGQSLILLVPEQATYQAERAILAGKKISGYNRLHVLSFDRLQFWLSGKNTARPELTRLGQQMIIHRILRENKSKLKIFGSSATWPGLGRQMAQTISELHQYAKTPDDIDQLLSELKRDERNSLAGLKFTDIGLIFREYLKFIEGNFLDPDVQLTRASREVAKADFVRGAKLWVDGFASFITSEIAVLAELLKVVADAQIALCLDPGKIEIATPPFLSSTEDTGARNDVELTNPNIKNIDPTDLFYPTECTYVELIELIQKCKLHLAKPIILDKAVRFGSFAQLAHIEQNIFKALHSPSDSIRRTPSGEKVKIPAENNIRIISAPNARAEVRFVAQRILRLVKEKGYRYRDIAVIASDIGSYEHYIRAYFGDYRVPFFIDKRKPLNQHPIVQLICSALQVITGGFSHSDIFAYLKTDLVLIQRYPAPIDCEPARTKTDRAKSLSVQDNRCGIDVLENYCLAYGITGDDWQSDDEWHFASDNEKDFDEKQINQIRQRAVSSLVKLRDSLFPPDNPEKQVTAEDFTRAIFIFLDDLQIRRSLAGCIDEAMERKDYSAVDEHRQFYDKLVSIFDELVEVFAGQQMACQDYQAIISTAFSQLTLAFIPPTLDQVLVGSIERSRHPDLKAVFLIGATQRQFPVPVTFDNILSEDDRSAAESANFPLAPAASDTLAERQYLAYIAFTRPSEFLCVTYPVIDDKGSAAVRSQFVDELRALFENLDEEQIPLPRLARRPDSRRETRGQAAGDAGARQDETEQVHNEYELMELLCSQLGKDDSRYSMLDSRYSFEASRRQYSDLLGDICADERLSELGSNVAYAINYDNRAQLNKSVLKELFGKQIRSSATRLRTFAACPYQYFARYILELKERKEFKFEPLDVGNFYHRVLDLLLKQINTEKKNFATIEHEDLMDILSKQITKLIQNDSFISNFKRRREYNEYIIQAAIDYLENFVPAIAQMVRAGSFRPTLSEVSFGEVKNVIKSLGEYALDISDKHKLFLDGKIDRLDIAGIDGRKVAIVFDYKRKQMLFNWSELYYGLGIQLPIYLLAVMNAKDSKAKEAAGAFYIPVEVPPAQSTLDTLSDKTESFNYKAKGIFDGEYFQQLDKTANSGWSKFYSFRITSKDRQYGDYGKSSALSPEHFEAVLKFTEKKIVQLAKEILSGKIDVNPYRLNTNCPCSYCKYKPVCRFDWQINDYNFLESLGKPGVLERMEKE